MHPDWPRGLLAQCKLPGVDMPYFFKQWGEWMPIATPRKGWCGPMELIHVNGARRKADWSDITESKGPEWGVVKVGKKLAGRTLDGRTWDEMPGAHGA